MGSPYLTDRHQRILAAGVSGGAIDGAVADYNENAGTVYNARELRRQFDKMMMGWDVRTSGGLATSGIANGGVARYYGIATTGDQAVIQRAAGANMSVDVLLGASMVGGTENSNQGEYFVFNDATINVVISASDPTNPRIDVIGVQIRDKEYSGATDDARILVITGTPAGAPAVPTLPADFLSLAHVAVAAAAGSIVTANITDKRRQITALGGVIPCTSATRPTVNLWTGMVILETDSITASGPVCQVYNSGTAAWEPMGYFARGWAVLAEISLGADTTMIFSAIPQTFLHLEVVGSLRSAGAVTNEAARIRFSNDATAIYDCQIHYSQSGAGAAAGEQNQTSGRIFQVPGTTANASVFACGAVRIPFYRDTNRFNHYHGNGGHEYNSAAVNPIVIQYEGARRSATAITQIDLINASGTTFKQNSRATLLAMR